MHQAVDPQPIAKLAEHGWDDCFGYGRTHRRGSARRAGTVPPMVEHQRVITDLIAPIRDDQAAVQYDAG
jgi:hypothetical protein